MKDIYCSMVHLPINPNPHPESSITTHQYVLIENILSDAGDDSDTGSERSSKSSGFGTGGGGGAGNSR